VDVEKPKFNVKPQALPGKKRVAHDAKHTEVSGSLATISLKYVFVAASFSVSNFFFCNDAFI